jgi:hypothetical protein
VGEKVSVINVLEAINANLELRLGVADPDSTSASYTTSTQQASRFSALVPSQASRPPLDKVYAHDTTAIYNERQLNKRRSLLILSRSRQASIETICSEQPSVISSPMSTLAFPSRDTSFSTSVCPDGLDADTSVNAALLWWCGGAQCHSASRTFRDTRYASSFGRTQLSSTSARRSCRCTASLHSSCSAWSGAARKCYARGGALFFGVMLSDGAVPSLGSSCSVSVLASLKFLIPIRLGLENTLCLKKKRRSGATTVKSTDVSSFPPSVASRTLELLRPTVGPRGMYSAL